MVVIDTNLLVYAHRAGVPEHRAARAAIERAIELPAGWGIALPSVPEFYSVVTHPRSEGGPSSPGQASEFLRVLVEEGGAQVWGPGQGFWQRLVRAAKQLDVQGPRIFDLQIGLIAAEHGVRQVWTHDRGFIAPAGVKVIDPLEA